MGDRIERFPLFPLRMVLLPSELVPLYVFEERYKLMVGECLEQEREFGIVWVSDEGVSDVGCTAWVSRVLERSEDGRMRILVQGGRPFRLLRRIGDMPYPAGDVEVLDDGDASAVDPDLEAGARARYADLVARVTDSRPDEDDLERLDAYRMAATVEFAPELKQRLLELRSEEDRLRMVAQLFGTTIRRLEREERTVEVSKGNGHIRF